MANRNAPCDTQPSFLFNTIQNHNSDDWPISFASDLADQPSGPYAVVTQQSPHGEHAVAGAGAVSLEKRVR